MMKEPQTMQPSGARKLTKNWETAPTRMVPEYTRSPATTSSSTTESDVVPTLAECGGGVSPTE